MTPLLILLTLYCALMAVVCVRILHAALWLAVVSALTSLMLYRLGAWQIAVIELSVGAGMVTVLMVFAISLVGEPTDDVTPQNRTPLVLVFIPFALILALVVPLLPAAPSTANPPVEMLLWQRRGLDMVAQVVVLFSAVLGVLGLLEPSRESASQTDLEEQTNTNYQTEIGYLLDASLHKEAAR
jgi:NADH:ubiquinone oxidoreductase subunit 6 (subunit J)